MSDHLPGRHARRRTGRLCLPNHREVWQEGPGASRLIHVSARKAHAGIVTEWRSGLSLAAISFWL